MEKRWVLLLLLLTLLALWLPASAATELLVNGDASRGLAGWIDPDGIWITRTEYENQVTAYDGYFFMPSAFKTYGARTRIYQDVSVSGLAGAETEFSAMVRTWDTNNTDETLLMVEYLDARGNLLGQAEVTSANDPNWHRIGVKSIVPAGAVTARLSLYAVYWYGSECDSYFDSVSFAVSGGTALEKTGQRSAYARVEGEGWDDTLGASLASEGGGNAGYIDNGDWTAYYGLDFGDGASTFAVNASSGNQGGAIEIRLDAPDGRLIGECTVTATGGWDSWKDFRCPVTGATGVHDVYLVYHGGSGYLLNVNYFWFEPAGRGASAAEAEIRQAEQRGIVPGCLQGVDLSEYIRATEFAALGVQLFEEFWQTQEIPETTPYIDVPGHPLQTEIEKAYGLGFLKYIRATELGDNGLTRQMMAQMLCALIKLFDEDAWTFETDSQFPLAYSMPQPFADDADIFKSSRDSVYYLASLGIMGSVENNRFYPSAAATREQAIVAANRIWTMEQGDDEFYSFPSAEPEPVWNEPSNTGHTGKTPQEETPAHCWVLVETVHEVYPDELDGARTWKYEYKDIFGGGQYVIDYTWSYHDEYSHYTAVGECANPPAYILPNQRFTVGLRVYNENVVGERGWGILGMGYIQYDSRHYAFTKGFFNVIENDPISYNANEADRSWQLWAEFPEGVADETISFTCQFHRGDRHPVKTTWTYAWRD